MGTSDYAIVIGIERYDDPGLGVLKGPGRDARRFCEWVTDPGGGAVSPDNVVVLAAEEPEPEANIQRIEQAFVKLCQSTTNRYRGRRLYIYLAGHGIAQNAHEASMLAADGGRNERERHVPGWHWLNWFLESAYFDEVVLFSDCCRTVDGQWPVRAFPLPQVKRGSPKRVHWVRGYAARYGGMALELRSDGGDRGAFTEALMEALRGARNEDGDVTASSVAAYFNTPPEVESVAWRDQEPSIVFSGDLVFSSRRASHTSVHLLVKGGARPVVEGGPGQRQWKVREGDLPGEYRVDLPRGLYAASAGDAERFFKVSGEPGDFHVSF
ncbi:MAG TPA: hypothetical protein VFA20_19165 [Myxococcaceae bacterium]|nr:hypothetical protein [Myxococcaceae bacterium]